MNSSDICIIGAGPAGVAAALTLSKKNIPCTIIDKSIFPRDKVCGDAISGKAVEVLNKIDPTIIKELSKEPFQLDSWGVTFVAPNEKFLRVPFTGRVRDIQQGAPGFISRRMDFDNFLVRKMKASGLITFLEGIEITEYNKGSAGWIISDKSREIELQPKILIIANGAQSSFTRKFTAVKQEPGHYCAGLRAYYKGVSELDHENFIELHFLKEFLPGYFWIFPLPNGFANVGVGMRSDVVGKRKVNLRSEMLNIIQKNSSLRQRFANAELVGDIQGYGLPLGSKKRKISGDGFMLTGDAAYLIDPFTGEGIGNAMVSGVLAAEQAVSAIEEQNFSAAFLAKYDQQFYKKLWSELKLSRRMQQLVEYPWLFNFVVNKANKNRALRETISCMFEDIDLRKKLKKPSFYVSLLFNN